MLCQPTSIDAIYSFRPQFPSNDAFLPNYVFVPCDACDNNVLQSPSFSDVIPCSTLCLDIIIMATPHRAWTIDDVVKDVYQTRVLEDRTEEEVLTTIAHVHVGPYVDVRYSSRMYLSTLQVHHSYRSPLSAGKGEYFCHRDSQGRPFRGVTHIQCSLLKQNPCKIPESLIAETKYPGRVEDLSLSALPEFAKPCHIRENSCTSPSQRNKPNSPRCIDVSHSGQCLVHTYTYLSCRFVVNARQSVHIQQQWF